MSFGEPAAPPAAAERRAPAPSGALAGVVLLFQVLRARQWVKNLLLFVPVLLAHHYFDRGPLAAAALAVLSFSLCASAVYVLNDLRDVESDRHHPIKRQRPFASGRLRTWHGVLLVPLLLVASLILAAPLPPVFLLALLSYLVVTSLYTYALKEVALADVLVLASLYTLRILAGAAATSIPVSEWLLAFSMFLFLSLAAVKRYAEARRLRAGGEEGVKIRGRGYFVEDLELIQQIGLSCGLLAVLVLALYISSDAVTRLYERPALLWFACPALLYWVSRVWLLAHRRTIEDDPLSFALRDPTTWLLAAVTAGVVVAAGRGW
jgi:4-hydroxybenzoate polyprenyltransferase